MQTRTLVLAAALGLALVGCGTTADVASDDATTTTGAPTSSTTRAGSTTTSDGGSGTTGTTPSSRPATSTTAPASKADEAAVQEAVDAFDRRGVAAGLTLKPAEAPSTADGSSGDDLTFEGTECESFNDAFPDDQTGLPGETASVDSNGLEKDVEGSLDKFSVDLSVATVTSPDDLDGVFGLYGDDRLLGCIESAITATAGDSSGATFDKVQAERLDVGEVGEEVYAVEVTADIAASGMSFPFAATLLVARQDRAAALMSISSLGSAELPIDPAQELQQVLDDVTGA